MYLGQHNWQLIDEPGMPATGSARAGRTIEMRSHSHILFLTKQSHFIIWNHMDHLQFEPPPEFSLRLFATLQNPGKSNQSRECDRQLLQAGILTDQRKQEDQWVWDPLSKICHFGTRDIPYNYPPKSSEEWAKQYADHCRKTIARIVTPSVNIEREVAIALRRISSHLGTCSEIS